MRFEERPKPEDRELKKKVRNFSLALMATISFGSGIEAGRRMERSEQPEPKQEDTADQPDYRKLLKGVSDEIAEPPAEQPKDVKPRQLEPKPAEEIETELAANKAVSFDRLYNFRHRGRFNNAGRAETSLESYWLDYYQKNPNMLAGKQKAYKELSQWLPAIDSKLAREGIADPELRSLLPIISIVENEKISDKKANKKGAVGMFGFTGPTAKKYLEVNKEVDERFDPADAGVASYKVLRDNRKGIGNLKLAVAAYNGRAWTFVKKTGVGSGDADYHDYLRYSEAELNQIKQETESDCWEIYRVKKGETLISVVENYRRSGRQRDAEKIFQANNAIGRERKLRGGEKIIVPLGFAVKHSEKEREEVFGQRIKGIRENLNYVAKVMALKTLMDRGYFKETKPAISFSEAKQAKGEKKIHFQDKAKRHGVSKNDIAKVNPKYIKGRIPSTKEVKYRVPLKLG
jgi:hypothetical protein